MLFIIMKHKSWQSSDVATLRRWNVAVLGCFLTFSSVDQASRRCDVTTLLLVFHFFFLQFQKATENHPIHLQCTQDPKIKYRAIMHLLKYKIELKHSKDVGMT